MLSHFMGYTKMARKELYGLRLAADDGLLASNTMLQCFAVLQLLCLLVHTKTNLARFQSKNDLSKYLSMQHADLRDVTETLKKRNLIAYCKPEGETYWILSVNPSVCHQSLDSRIIQAGEDYQVASRFFREISKRQADGISPLSELLMRAAESKNTCIALHSRLWALRKRNLEHVYPNRVTADSVICETDECSLLEKQEQFWSELEEEA